MCFDILVVHDRKDQRWASEFVGALSYGRNPYSVFRSALIGRRRSVQLVFDDPGDLDPVLLWRRGDSLAIAVGRLNRIEAVEGAGRAPRDAMLPEFDGLDRWLPRRHREVLQAAVSSGAIMLGRLTLPDETPVWDPIAAAHLDERWNADSPLHRAGQAVLAQYEARGINARQAHLHGHDVHDRDTPYFAGFNLRYFRTVPWCLTKHGGVEWIEVTARRFLDVWTERGDDGDIVGMGLTCNRTPHQVRVGGARMWTWCAEDTLIFAIVLNRPVTVESTAPGSAERCGCR